MKNIAEKSKTEMTLVSENAISDLAQDVEEKYRVFTTARQSYDTARLRKRMDAFLRKDKFKQGQIVAWKEDMRNRKKPEYGQPAVVIEVLKEPLKDLSGAGTISFNEPLDLLVGFFDEDGDWVALYVDARRFELFEESADDQTEKE